MRPDPEVPSGRLLSLLAEGQVDPGSKRLSVGLAGYNPVDAARRLIADETAMSVVLHELTHFHSLTNNIGVLLTARALIRLLAGSLVEGHLQQKTQGLDAALKHHLTNHFEFQLMLEAWRPLLEGVAIYLQTSYPCADIEQLAKPVDTLTKFGGALAALDPPEEPAGPRFNDWERITAGLLPAAQRALAAGPRLPISPSPSLAVALELIASPWSLIYFLGHAFVRGVQARCRRIAPQFECPEIFLTMLLRILRSSGQALLDIGQRSGWDSPQTIDGLYGWVELFGQAPADRLARLPHLEDRVDVLRFLGDGKEEIKPYLTVGGLASLLEEQLSEEWGFWNKQGLLQSVIPAVILQTHTVNFTSNGTCQVVGWAPGALDGAHGVALRVSDKTWWLAVEDSGLATLGIDVSAIPRLRPEAFQNQAKLDIPPNALLLKMDSFWSETPQWPKGTDLDLHYLVTLRNETVPQSFLLVELKGGPKGSFRGVLRQASSEQTEVFWKMESFRPELETGVNLKALADALEEEGHSSLAAFTQESLSHQQGRLAGQRQLWIRRSLTGLLGAERACAIRKEIEFARLGHIQFLDLDQFHQLISAAYSVPVQVNGPGADELDIFLEDVNKEARERIGKPLFGHDENGHVVYLGLWDPAE